MSVNDHNESKGSNRPRRDNVIYANFGNRSRKRGNEAASKSNAQQPVAERVRRDRVFGEPAQKILSAATRQADQGRISRGRDYARDGHVVDLVVRKARVDARVAGSQNEPFNVSLTLPFRSPDDLGEVSRILTETPNGMRRAQQGELPDDALNILLGDNLDDFRFSCDCPDPNPVCKHAVALSAILADKMQQDPSVVFSLRGLDFYQLQRMVDSNAHTVSAESAEGSDERFWNGLDLPDLPEPKTAPAIDDADPDLLNKAMRSVSYTSMDQLRAVSDIEDLYDHLTR